MKSNDDNKTPLTFCVSQAVACYLAGQNLGVDYESLATLVGEALKNIADSSKPGDKLMLPGGVSYQFSSRVEFPDNGKPRVETATITDKGIVNDDSTTREELLNVICDLNTVILSKTAKLTPAQDVVLRDCSKRLNYLRHFLRRTYVGKHCGDCQFHISGRCTQSDCGINGLRCHPEKNACGLFLSPDEDSYSAL